MNDMPAAALDIGNRAVEDGGMDTTMDTLRLEMGAGFREVNARIDALRQETAENFKLVEVKIQEARRESNDNFRLVEAKIEHSRRDSFELFQDVRKSAEERFMALHAQANEQRAEINAHIEILRSESQKRLDRGDTQFRWLVGLVVAGMIALAGWISKVQLY